MTSSGGDVLTAGFVITGNAPKRVLVRAAGPALTRFGVTGALAQVRLDVYRGSALIASNAGWDASGDGASLARTMEAVGAFAFAPGSRDAALEIVLAPANYTAQAQPAAGGPASGVALVEIYDADSTGDSQLVNLSARGRVGTGAETLTVGFVIPGDGRNRMLVRAAGPALAGFGVPGAIADPRLELFQGPASIAYNDDWQSNTSAGLVAEVTRKTGAFAFASGSRDATVMLPAASGAYTAHVSDAATGAGVALVEVYDTAAGTFLPPARVFDLVGFGRVAGLGLAVLAGGGTPTVDYNPATRAGNFWRIDDATIAAADFASQLQAALSSDQPLVVELNTMLDLSRFGRPNNGSTAIAHPDLFTAGRTTGTVGFLMIGANKTIYSAFGNGGFRRGTVRVDGKSNIILRNLKFRELWEWDDATSGDYDRNGWDFISVSSNTSGANVTSRAHHVWIDHCDFEKAYDGLMDLVHGADLMTVSWCKIAGAVSGETVRWVQRQMDYLEENRARFPYYNAQRASVSQAELLRRELFQKKSNLVGNGTDADTAAHDLGYLNVTFHHNWYPSVDQRMPRMRFGNAHVFNLLADSSAGRNVSGLTLAGVAATSNAAVRVENSWFIDTRTPINNSVGIEPLGRIAVVGSTNFDSTVRVDRGFDPTRVVPLAEFRWNAPAGTTGIGNWPQADSAVMPASYVPPGRTLADYVDPSTYLEANLAQVGVIVPADANEAEVLRQYLQRTTATP